MKAPNSLQKDIEVCEIIYYCHMRVKAECPNDTSPTLIQHSLLVNVEHAVEDALGKVYIMYYLYMLVATLALCWF